MKLMLIDGNSIVNRAFYGIRMLNAPDGTPTNGVYGFLTILQRLLDEEKPEGLAVTFDLHAPTFRHLRYADYKGTRKGMPEDLQLQMPVLKQVLDAMGVLRLEKEGWEADDLLGTLSRRCEAAGDECVVVTGDKDSFQLITEKTRVLHVKSRMGQTETINYTPERFREEYGFDPIRMIDLKALMGDASDNIPGVAGVGEKTAMALVQMYGSVEKLYADMPQVLMAPETPAKPGVIRKLEAGKEMAEMSKMLATIVTDAPLEFEAADNLRREATPALYDLFLRLEFTKLIEKMGLSGESEKPVQAEEQPRSAVSETVDTWERAEQLIALWRTCESVSCLVLPELGGVCAAWQENGENRTARFFPHRLEDYNAFLRAFFSEDIRKVTCEAKELIRALMAENLPYEGIVFDVSLAAYLLDATAGHYDLNHLSVSWLGCETAKPLYLQDDVFTAMGEDAQALEAWEQHAALIVQLYEKLSVQLREMEVEELYRNVEMPLCTVLADMENLGFLVDAGALQNFGAVLTAAIESLEQQIYAHAGQFNINSPRQLGEVLFERLGLPVQKKTKTGYSTNAEVLDKLRGMHPIVGEVLEYRQYAKLKSTYVDGLLKVIGQDGRVRTSFQMTVTATGRLSSTEPNLQNIPTRTELGSELRRMFTAAPGKVLVDADYSQIELRLLAHISDDARMIETFRSGGDIHTATAAQVFAVAEDEVTSAMRRSAKAVNFGIVYGISPFSLSQDIGVTVAEAKAYMDAYFARYGGVKRYMEQVVSEAKERGYVETLWHRRRALPEIKSSNFNMRAFGERVALNMPIQGTAADIIKLAMVRVYARLKEELPEAKLIMQVHDELIVECGEAQTEQVKRILTEEMEQVAVLSVPLTAEAHSGKNWLEAK